MSLCGFKICDGKGFHITFQNGWTISVQFGGGNYSGNYDEEIDSEAYLKQGARGSGTAEIACWDKDKKWVEGHPLGWQTPEQFAALIAEIASKP